MPMIRQQEQDDPIRHRNRETHYHEVAHTSLAVCLGGCSDLPVAARWIRRTIGLHLDGVLWPMF